MTTGTTANSSSRNALHVKIMKVSKIAGTAVAFGGLGFLLYAAFQLNSENISINFRLEATGQRVEYLERTPRSGILSKLPWNDDNGHAIIEIYTNDGNLEMKAYDEKLDGSLLGQDDWLEVILTDNKKVTCFPDKAINSAGIKTVFRADNDPVENAKIAGVEGYCMRQLESADSIYKTVRASK